VQTIGHRPGAFCWVELATNDLHAAARFYGELFAWKIAGRDGSLAFATLRGAKVAGVRELAPAQRELGVPPHWAASVCVEDVDATLRAAGRLGGTPYGNAFDDAGMARRGAIQDPGGAFLGLWQRRGLPGIELLEEPGALAWCELYSRAPVEVAGFYAGLFGWSARPVAAPGPRMWIFDKDERPVASLMEIQPEWGAMPSTWQVAFSVAECDRTVEVAVRMGAKTIVPPKSVPPAGRFASLFDPQGAAFAVLEG
jgi:hypothetical protein